MKATLRDNAHGPTQISSDGTWIEFNQWKGKNQRLNEMSNEYKYNEISDLCADIETFPHTSDPSQMVPSPNKPPHPPNLSTAPTLELHSAYSFWYSWSIKMRIFHPGMFTLF